jgi:hypothetical protein
MNAKESLELGLCNLPRIQIINLSMKFVRRVDSKSKFTNTKKMRAFGFCATSLIYEESAFK